MDEKTAVTTSLLQALNLPPPSGAAAVSQPVTVDDLEVHFSHCEPI